MESAQVFDVFLVFFLAGSLGEKIEQNLKEAFFFTPWNHSQIDLAVVAFFSATIHRRDMIRRALDAPMSVDYFTYLHHGLMIHKKFFRGLQSRRSHYF